MNTVLRKLRTASRFPLDQWFLFAESYLILLGVRCLLIFSSPRAVEKALFRKKEKSLQSLPKKTHPDEELLRSFDLALRYQPVKTQCLARSLAQKIFLSRHGFPTKFRIGVKKENGRLKAHAWCEQPEAGGGIRPEGEAIFQALESVSREGGVLPTQ